ncbi:BatA domain-containing protein [Flavitalea sp. BT771]|uniref:BatA domain-containing protein n=1 Tax=Flavitalea sp. BT771 TaxID=3063329 RepID=UPI0026E4733B|nr:BatA domain-containing protein [Flavitalea sp. BT771]MDO6434974.1 BatA domain-containing protein [Flavitalea sp. BT771]MDV6223874.1 BatA domain-containing protein [Flavitalea sp. BT771]
MLQLLQPIWLFAMAGIVFPVVIHLWNNKQGKVLAIGSVALLEKTSRKKSRSRTVSEWLLLLMRCLLLLLLALLLAGPYWKKTDGAGKKGWVLVGEEPLRGEVRAVMDSLIKIGWERHDLAGASRWADVSSLDRQAAPEIPFCIFSDDLLQHFAGARPVTTRMVRWYVNPAGDSVVKWVDKMWAMEHDSVGVISGSSGPTGSTYKYEEMERRAADRLDTSVLRVAIYADGIDGQWVGAAVRALQQFTHRRLEATSYKLQAASDKLQAASRKLQTTSYELRAASRGLGKMDWVFWLSGRAVPPGLKAANILFYEPGKEIPVDTWVGGTSVRVEKTTAQTVQADTLQPVWVDGFGKPLLGLEEREDGRRWHFFSRFDPAWNGLVWSAGFPLYLQELLFGKEQPAQDRRMIDPQQMVLAYGRRDIEAPMVNAGAAVDLAPAGWVLICLLLLFERILSFKRSRNNG